MKIFGYKIVKVRELKALSESFEDLKDIHKRSQDKISRLESALTACQRRIDDQERSIAKYQRIVGTNSKPKWTWEKWK